MFFSGLRSAVHSLLLFAKADILFRPAQPILLEIVMKRAQPNWLGSSSGMFPFQYGAGGGGRTRTVLPPRDFESRTSASSITPACYSDSITDCFVFFNCFFCFAKTFSCSFLFFPRRIDAFCLSVCYTTSIIDVDVAVFKNRYTRPAGRKDGSYEKSLCHHRIGAGYFRHCGWRCCGGIQLYWHETAPRFVIRKSSC